MNGVGKQAVFNASLIKSRDRGRPRTRSARENYDAPIWAGTRFGGPSFIHYGRNGGRVAHDRANEFVYVVSNNGFWNGGDDSVLARVRRADLPKLNAADWQYFTGGDGLQDRAWSPDLTKANPSLSLPARMPVTVTVAAWQWDRSNEPAIQTAEIVERSFEIAVTD